MNNNIEAGDTVQIIDHCPCGSSKEFLWMYSIAQEVSPRIVLHRECGRPPLHTRLVYIDIGDYAGWFPTRWLRKVPPLDEIEKVQDRQTAPVKEKVTQ